MWFQVLSSLLISTNRRMITIFTTTYSSVNSEDSILSFLLIGHGVYYIKYILKGIIYCRFLRIVFMIFFYGLCWPVYKNLFVSSFWQLLMATNPKKEQQFACPKLGLENVVFFKNDLFLKGNKKKKQSQLVTTCCRVGSQENHQIVLFDADHRIWWKSMVIKFSNNILYYVF